MLRLGNGGLVRLVFLPSEGNYIALILVPDEVCRQETVRGLSGHFFSFCVRLLVNLLVRQDMDVSPAIGCTYPDCVCLVRKPM